jgi:hypothetical protein
MIFLSTNRYWTETLLCVGRRGKQRQCESGELARTTTVAAMGCSREYQVQPQQTGLEVERMWDWDANLDFTCGIECGSRRLICVEDQEREEGWLPLCSPLLSRTLWLLLCSISLLPRAGWLCGLNCTVPLEFTFCIWDELCNGFCVCDFSFVFNAF